MFSVLIIKNKYYFHIINKIINMINLLKDIVYTYEYKKINTSI